VAARATAATSWYPDYPTVMNIAKNEATLDISGTFANAATWLPIHIAGHIIGAEP
jgi:hypothetical protein